MPGPLSALDWAIVLSYIAFSIGVGVLFTRRASESVDEYFLSGRTLSWWMAGTSMVATSFAADTPLLVTGWVRDDGIWKNWVWWCLLINGMLQVFLFSRWWRRAGVMTKAELVELRYGGVSPNAPGAKSAGLLRATLAIVHSSLTNTMTICWVMLAAGKISEVLFEVPRGIGLSVACAIALTYSLLSGFWGVVVTDLLQFVMAMGGAIALATISWVAVGGSSAVLEAVSRGDIPVERIAFVPSGGADGFWTTSMAALFVYLGVSWWAIEMVDGATTAVQRIEACKNEREGLLSMLWFNLAHYALRPWCWILVALASLLVLPNLEVRSPTTGGARVVQAVGADAVVLAGESGADPLRVSLAPPGSAPDWKPIPLVEPGDSVQPGDPLARTDSELAYMVMMVRYLPVGLLGLVAASLLAAFMSTIDTHVNLAASYFVNDLYRRFLHEGATEGHYVAVARIASFVVLLVGAFFASKADSVRDLYVFFLAFLAGAGPVYVMRWLWWRVRASTELTAMLTSAVVSTAVTHGFGGIHWSLGPLSEDGALTSPGRVVVVALVSIVAAGLSMLLTPTPDPAELTRFYAKTRPFGWWRPVAKLCGVEGLGPREEILPA
ncbi:MAG TPA: hypothetical protein ENJ09_10720, partial [Planctomycetes bacterium]|nr:hypothetical protein [Planctomycetota bacterium]